MRKLFKDRALLFALMAIGGFILLLGGCSKKSADTLSGSGPCDTISVSYVKDILPIMQSYCYSCHGNGNTAFSNGVVLEGSDSGYKELSSWAAAGYVVGNVTYASGFIGMPYGKPKLDVCEINKIIAWVNQQYPH
jgi:hypothetical protein